MATSTGQDGKIVCTADVDLLLHPELLSQEFMQLILSGKHVSTRDCETRDQLTELYLRHVIPRPQRTSSNDHNRKRPLVVFDGRASHSGPLKVKKPEGTTVSAGIPDRLKPPPAASLSNPIRRLSGITSSSSIHCSTDTANLQREANSSTELDVLAALWAQDIITFSEEATANQGHRALLTVEAVVVPLALLKGNGDQYIDKNVITTDGGGAGGTLLGIKIAEAVETIGKVISRGKPLARQLLLAAGAQEAVLMPGLVTVVYTLHGKLLLIAGHTEVVVVLGDEALGANGLLASLAGGKRENMRRWVGRQTGGCQSTVSSCVPENGRHGEYTFSPQPYPPSCQVQYPGLVVTDNLMHIVIPPPLWLWIEASNSTGQGIKVQLSGHCKAIVLLKPGAYFCCKYSHVERSSKADPIITTTGKRVRVSPPEFVPFPLALSCTSPGVGDVTTGTGDQANRRQHGLTTGDQMFAGEDAVVVDFIGMSRMTAVSIGMSNGMADSLTRLPIKEDGLDFGAGFTSCCLVSRVVKETEIGIMGEGK
ncbi:hypothetical protein FQN60_001181 [Etheostoma spectabile]|uniref:Ashwin n=1 Tax=Etheostoma spectabile TaxID=54343 RepID=A0A5J5D1X8_9PERO|nr:hypothetical protein FQN60_001181 [Etheostoma spectabile]